LLEEAIRSKKSCHLNEKAVEDQKAAKEAAEPSNAQAAGPWCPATKPKKSQEDTPSLIINSPRNFDRKARS
jgi:hypothetical protein